MEQANQRLQVIRNEKVAEKNKMDEVKCSVFIMVYTMVHIDIHIIN